MENFHRITRKGAMKTFQYRVIYGILNKFFGYSVINPTRRFSKSSAIRNKDNLRLCVDTKLA